MSHINNGACPKCLEIFNRYPGAHPSLKKFFFNFQARVKDGHISCAGRGKADQEIAFKQGKSRAKWAESAHNYNLAMDIFRLTQNGAEWMEAWYKVMLMPEITVWNLSPQNDPLEWYGYDFSPFREMPHVQIKAWKSLVDAKLYKLVE